MNKIDLSIVIVSWNTKKLLDECLDSIYKETKEISFEIIVVDNNSPDKSNEMVREKYPDVILIDNVDNKGFAPANNQALEICKGAYILLLNPDTKIIDRGIDKLFQKYISLSASMKLGVLACKLLNGDLSLQKSVNKFYNFWNSILENRFFGSILERIKLSRSPILSLWDHSENRPIDWAFGAVMLFKREVFEKVGYLDYRFYIYAEEMDYFIRVKKAGYVNYFTPEVSIIHYGKSSSTQKRSAMFIQNYKSFYLFLLKHYGPFSYYIYRFRATFYLFVWYIVYSIKNDEFSKIQRQVYKETIQWHLTKSSTITLV